MYPKSLMVFFLTHFIYFHQNFAQPFLKSALFNNWITSTTNRQKPSMALCKKKSDVYSNNYCIRNETFDCLDIPGSVALCDYHGKVKSILLVTVSLMIETHVT